MIIKYFEYWKLKEFHVDTDLSTKKLVHKIWKLILQYSTNPQHNKFWIFDDNDNYIAVVNTEEGKLNFIKNLILDTPKDIINQSGFNIKWDNKIYHRFVFNILSEWRHEYFKKYGYAKNYDLDINLFLKAYKKFVNNENKLDELYLLSNWEKYNNLTESEQQKLKIKYSNLFTYNIGTWKKPKLLTIRQFRTGRNAEVYSEMYNISENNFFLNDKLVWKEIQKLSTDENKQIYWNFIEAIKSDKNLVDNLLANSMIQTTKNTVCYREFGMHSYKFKNENWNGFVSASLIDRRNKWLGQEYDYERCEPFILPKGFYYIPNINYNGMEPLEPGEILIWNPNLCKL